MKKGQQSVVRLLTPISLSEKHKEIPEIGMPQEVQYARSCFVKQGTIPHDCRISIRWFVLCASRSQRREERWKPQVRRRVRRQIQTL